MCAIQWCVMFEWVFVFATCTTCTWLALALATRRQHFVLWFNQLSSLFEMVQFYTHRHHDLLQNIWALHIKICICNVSVAPINGNNIPVGDPSVRSYDATRFGARARAVEPCKPCKGCVRACFGARWFARICFRVQVSDITRRTKGFIPVMYPLYGKTVTCAG